MGIVEHGAVGCDAVGALRNGFRQFGIDLDEVGRVYDECSPDVRSRSYAIGTQSALWFS